MLKSRSTNNIPFIDTTNFTLSKSNKYQLHYVLYIFMGIAIFGPTRKSDKIWDLFNPH